MDKKNNLFNNQIPKYAEDDFEEKLKNIKEKYTEFFNQNIKYLMEHIPYTKEIEDALQNQENYYLANQYQFNEQTINYYLEYRPVIFNDIIIKINFEKNWYIELILPFNNENKHSNDYNLLNKFKSPWIYLKSSNESITESITIEKGIQYTHIFQPEVTNALLISSMTKKGHIQTALMQAIEIYKRDL